MTFSLSQAFDARNQAKLTGKTDSPEYHEAENVIKEFTALQQSAAPTPEQMQIQEIIHRAAGLNLELVGVNKLDTMSLVDLKAFTATIGEAPKQEFLEMGIAALPLSTLDQINRMTGDALGFIENNATDFSKFILTPVEEKKSLAPAGSFSSSMSNSPSPQFGNSAKANEIDDAPSPFAIKPPTPLPL